MWQPAPLSKLILSATRKQWMQFGVISAVVLIVLAGAWAARLPVVGHVVRAVSAQMGYPVTLRVTAFGLGGLRAENVVMGAPGRPDFTAETVSVRYRLTDLFGLRVRALELEGAMARGRLTDDGLVVAGVPLSGPEPGARPMRLSVRDSVIVWETVTGDIPMRLDMDGDYRAGWTVHAGADPGNYGNAGFGVRIEQALVSAVLKPESAEASVVLRLSDLAAPRWRARDVFFEASFAGLMSDPGAWRSLSGAGRAQASLTQGGLEDGVPGIVARMLAPLPGAPLAASVNPHVQEARFGLESAMRTFDARGDVLFELEGGVFNLQPAEPLSVDAASGFSARVQTAAESTLSFDGLEGVLTAQRVSLTASGPGLPEGEAFLAYLEADVSPWRARQLTARGDLQLAPWEAEGLMWGLELDAYALEADRTGWSAQTTGRMALEGRRAGLRILGGGFASELSIVARDDRLVLTPLEGMASRLTIDDAAFGEIAVRDLTSRVRGGSADGPLLTVTPEGFTLSAVFRDVDVLAARADFGARLRALAIELSHNTDKGDYSQAEHQWGVRIQGPRIDGRFSDASRILLDGRVLDLKLTRSPPEAPAGEGSAAAVSADMGRAATGALSFESLSIDAERAPVLFTEVAGEVVLNTTPGAPLDGRWTLSRARLGDRGLLPQFTPFAVSMQGDVTGFDTTGSAQVTLASSGRDLGNITFEYRLGAGHGVAQFETPRLLFTPDRLQPVDVLPVAGRLVRGARGGLQASGEARFIAPTPEGALGAITEATLAVNLDDFSVATPLGQLDTINTTFAFADIVDMRTDGPQSITLSAYDPGVPVTDLTLSVSLPGDGTLRIDPLRGVLAGGELVLSPIDIDIAQRRGRGVASVRSMDLAAFAGALGVDGLAMSGRVSGGGYVEFDPLAVSLRNFRLAALSSGAVAYEPLVDPLTSPGPGPGPWRALNYETLLTSLDGDLRSLSLQLRAQPLGQSEELEDAMLVNALTLLREAGATDVSR